MEILERPSHYVGPDLDPSNIRFRPRAFAESVYAFMASPVPRDNSGLIADPVEPSLDARDFRDKSRDVEYNFLNYERHLRQKTLAGSYEDQSHKWICREPVLGCSTFVRDSIGELESSYDAARRPCINGKDGPSITIVAKCMHLANICCQALGRTQHNMASFTAEIDVQRAFYNRKRFSEFQMIVEGWAGASRRNANLVKLPATAIFFFTHEHR